MAASINQPTLLTVDILGSKQCKRCKQVKERTEFTPHPECRDGLLNNCHECENEKRRLRHENLTPEQKEAKDKARRASKRRYAQSPRGRFKNKKDLERGRKRPWYAEYLQSDKRRAYYRNYRLKSTFNISLAEYEEMVRQQNNQCAACGDSPTMPRSGCKHGVLEVDHDHVTNEVRALLCGRCNRGLGQFGDDPERLTMALVYLRRFK